jgi:hypothetical protein
MWKLFTNLNKDESGQDLIEYAVYVDKYRTDRGLVSMKAAADSMGSGSAASQVQIINPPV